MRETAILTARGWTGTGPWYQTLAFKEPVTDGTAKVIQGASEKQQKAFADGSIQVSTINGWLVTFKATGNKPIVNIPIDFTYNLNSSEPLDSVVIVGTKTSSTAFSGTITKEAFNRLKEGNIPLIVSILDQTTKGTSMAIKMPSYTFDVQSNTISAMAPVIPTAGSSLNFWAVLVNSDYSVGGFISAGGGSGGATVSWTQIVTSGTKIGTIIINGISTDVYAPNGGLTDAPISATNTSATPTIFTGTQSTTAATWADIINGKAAFKVTMTESVSSVVRVAIIRDYIRVDANTVIASFGADDFTTGHDQTFYHSTFTYDSATLVMSARIISIDDNKSKVTASETASTATGVKTFKSLTIDNKDWNVPDASVEYIEVEGTAQATGEIIGNFSAAQIEKLKECKYPIRATITIGSTINYAIAETYYYDSYSNRIGVVFHDVNSQNQMFTYAGYINTTAGADPNFKVKEVEAESSGKTYKAISFTRGSGPQYTLTSAEVQLTSDELTKLTNNQMGFKCTLADSTTGFSDVFYIENFEETTINGQTEKYYFGVGYVPALADTDEPYVLQPYRFQFDSTITERTRNIEGRVQGQIPEYTYVAFEAKECEVISGAYVGVIQDPSNNIDGEQIMTMLEEGKGCVYAMYDDTTTGNYTYVCFNQFYQGHKGSYTYNYGRGYGFGITAEEEVHYSCYLENDGGAIKIHWYELSNSPEVLPAALYLQGSGNYSGTCANFDKLKTCYYPIHATLSISGSTDIDVMIISQYTYDLSTNTVTFSIYEERDGTKTKWDGTVYSNGNMSLVKAVSTWQTVITYGTSDPDPTAGADGDVYIKYSA